MGSSAPVVLGTSSRVALVDHVMTASVQVFGRLDDDSKPSANSRRPKSAKA
jgi:hypothetical protein